MTSMPDSIGVHGTDLLEKLTRNCDPCFRLATWTAITASTPARHILVRVPDIATKFTSRRQALLRTVCHHRRGPLLRRSRPVKAHVNHLWTQVGFERPVISASVLRVLAGSKVSSPGTISEEAS